MDGGPGKGIRDDVFAARLPPGREAVSCQGRLELKQTVIFDLVKAPVVEDGFFCLLELLGRKPQGLTARAENHKNDLSLYSKRLATSIFSLAPHFEGSY